MDDKELKKRKVRDVAFLRESIERKITPKTGGTKEEYISLMSSDLSSRNRQEDSAEEKDPNMAGDCLEHFIIVAAPQELDAGLEWTKDRGFSTEFCPIANRSGYRISIEFEDGELVDVGLLCATHKGNLAAKELIADVVRFEKPTLVLMVGMMGGIPGKVSLFDIVVPQIVYDGTAVGTRDGGILPEGRPMPVHERVPDILNGLKPKSSTGFELTVVRTKNSVSVGEKIDDLTTELAEAIISRDEENIVGIEMEAYAVASANIHQQLHQENTIFAVFKSVADYCSTVDEISAAERSKISNIIDLDSFDQPHNPTKNKDLKKAIQAEGTKLSYDLALDFIDRLRKHIVRQQDS